MNDFGFNIAGQSKRKKINPLTTLVRTNLSCGHFKSTALCKQPQIYRKLLGHISGLVKILKVTSSKICKIGALASIEYLKQNQILHIHKIILKLSAPLLSDRERRFFRTFEPTCPMSLIKRESNSCAAYLKHLELNPMLKIYWKKCQRSECTNIAIYSIFE